MRTIYKYELKIKEEQKLEITGLRHFLKISEQNGSLFLWCMVETKDESIYTTDIIIYGTGVRIASNLFNKATYFDSILMANGLVWHVALY